MDGAHLSLLPTDASNSPIYVGAFASKKMMGIVGELADGWFPGAFYTPKSFREKAEEITEAARRAGRNPRGLDLLVNLAVVFGNDSETRKKIKSALRGALVKNKYMLKLLGATEAHDYVSRSLQYQLIAPSRRYLGVLDKTIDSLPISDELLEVAMDEMMAVGTPDKCADSIARFVKAGATQVHVSTFLSGPRTYERFAKDVVPLLSSG